MNKEWQRNILAVREKINNAIQDMPAHDDIAALLSGIWVYYFSIFLDCYVHINILLMIIIFSCTRKRNKIIISRLIIF